jgi:hypothetical protein
MLVPSDATVCFQSCCLLCMLSLTELYIIRRKKIENRKEKINLKKWKEYGKWGLGALNGLEGVWELGRV